MAPCIGHEHGEDAGVTLIFDASDLRTKIIDKLGGSERRLRAAAATALTRTAVAVKAAEQREMLDSFDRPTPYTLNSLYVKPATAQSGEARVGIKDDGGSSRSAVNWLRWQILGGSRTQTGYEKLLTRAGAMRDDQRIVPAQGARLDAYGNVSRGQLVQILSQLRIDTTIGSTRALPRINANDSARQKRATANKIRRSYGKAGGTYVAFPNGRGRLKPGIYLNTGRDFGAKLGYGRSRSIVPVLLFVNSAHYQVRFDFGYAGLNEAKRTLPRELTRALAGSLFGRVQGDGGKWSAA
jgi:hypothetical protein